VEQSGVVHALVVSWLKESQETAGEIDRQTVSMKRTKSL
jgi:hypothetical protein